MKRLPPFYPVLIGIFPILSVFSTNQSFVPLPQLWRPLGIGLVASLGLWLLLSLLSRSLERGAAAASIIVASVYSFQTVIGWTPLQPDSTNVIGGWIALTLVIAVVAAMKWKWHQPVLLFSIILTLLPCARIAWEAVQYPAAKRIQLEGGASRTGSKPDIIYIILDGYGRSDVLKERYKFDNEFFVKGLKDRGFYVADKARATYCQTELSIGSTLNAEYLQDTVKERPEIAGSDRMGLRGLLSQNRVFARLRKEGYLISMIETGFPATVDIDVDRRISRLEGMSLLETTILQMTPIGKRSGVVTSMFEQRRQWILRAFDDLGTLGGQSGRPRFTFVHILAPHPPFSFGPNGEARRQVSSYGYWDGSDFMFYGGTREMYTQGYADQAKFISEKVLSALDRILSVGGPKPLVIIQGDHGPKRGLDQSSYEKTDAAECFPNLNAMLAPEEVQKELYPGITSVNTFRTIFRALFGDKMPNLPDRSWYSPYGRPLEFTEVTKRLN